ncbi:adenylyl-sulfate kinase [Georgenia sp. TF02-10]|uniref:adenylyl-sulfate kinase n=1 Tax=Georgenia sp. TF02-10 TaxID=2917725 RepID=UPI001FA77E6B|nr:adenylyl-sulfate kinase [Georgenia sp. TF02-10]UNX55588.1 adenylyl-sulfate kinase [Georgenia sp. TF02-10]
MTSPAPPLPRHALSAPELDVLDLLRAGALGPGAGYAAPDEGPVLVLPADVVAAAGVGPAGGAGPARGAGTTAAAGPAAVELTDAEGVPLAVVTVTQTYDHAGGVGVVGTVRHLGGRGSRPFDRLYLDPAAVRAQVPADALTVPVARPLSEEDLTAVTAARAGRTVVLLALAGHGPGGAAATADLLRATVRAAELVPDARVVAVPLPAAGAGPANARLRRRVLAAYAPGEVLEVAGRGPLPAAVAAAVRAGGARRGAVVLFTGLSGSGKSTLARALHDLVVEEGARTVSLLDGDVVRRNLSAGLSFSVADREVNVRRIGWVAAEIARHGGLAICSPIAPFDSTRRQVRAMVADAGGAFVLVHVATPLAECERRDRKGLYARARRGEVPDFTGISSPYEPPADADLVVDTTGRPVAEVLGEVAALLRGRDVLVG